jgi:opacity protein-like surface antigen
MAFYLEGLYTPDPANNGVWDYVAAQDTNYLISEPDLGLEPYSEEAADWKRDFDDFGLNNIAAAYPFNIMNKKLVVSGAYRNSRILDFDRNDTFLDPHIGYDEYGVVPRVVTDTVSFNWSRFERSRNGELNSIRGALALDLSEKIKLGIGINSVSGNSDDFQILDRVGHFDIAKDNRFRFTYDTVTTAVTGTSDYEALNFNLGVLIKLKNLSLGVNIGTPYTTTRTWSYNTVYSDTGGTISSNVQGKDKVKIPATYAFGINIRPVKRFTVAFDYQYTPYSKAKFNFESPDITHRDWVDQSIIRFGIEFRALEYLSLLTGYREIPATFVPDGAASLTLSRFGRVDFAYEYRRFKYNDSYFSNTNYTFENLNIYSFAYTFIL